MRFHMGRTLDAPPGIRRGLEMPECNSEGIGSPIERVPTPDGARLAIKRRVTKGGTPVIFLHGLAVNADMWDLPEVHVGEYHYRSLASVLHEAGFDIWLVNLRGHGGPQHMLSEPPPGQTDWCVDHFILYDLPAVVEHVLQTTGQRPFAVGASMGSMTLAGYVQGAHLTGAGAEAHIVADAATARIRQQQLIGCVFVELPAALRWPDTLYDEDDRLVWRRLLRDWRRTDGDVNQTFELLSRWGWLRALVAAAGEIPMGRLAAEDQAEAWYRKLPTPLADGIEQIERAAVQSMLERAGAFTGTAENRAEVVLRHGRRIMDQMKSGVLQQMAKCVRCGAFVSALGSPDHLYSEHYDLIGLPVLVLHGGRDRIANADVAREAFFGRLSSSDKQFWLYEDMSHGEIEAAPEATERIYQNVLRWMNERRPACS